MASWDELVVDGLFRLVFIARLRREVVAHEDETVLHVGKGDLALALGVLIVLAQVFVDRRDERQTCRLFRRTAVLKETRVVVVLDKVDAVGKAAGDVELDLVLGLVGAVASAALGSQQTGSVSASSPASSRI